MPLIFALISLVVVGAYSGQAQGKDFEQNVSVEKLAAYLSVRSARFSGWPASGGGAFIETGFGQRPQIFFYGAPLAERQQLTNVEGSIELVLPSPDNPNLIAFTADKSGDEYFGLFISDVLNNEVWEISGSGTKTDSAVWSADGAQIAWIEQNGKYRMLQVYDLDARSTITKDTWTRNLSLLDWSDDDQRMILKEVRSVRDNSIYLYEFGSTNMERLSSGNSPIAFGGASFGHGSANIYYTATSGNGFKALFRYDIQSRRSRRVSDRIRWDVDQFAVSPSNDLIAYTINRNGNSSLIVQTRRRRKLTTLRLPIGFISDLAFSPDGTELGFTLHASAAPSMVYSFNLLGRKKELKIWSGSEFGGLDPQIFREPEFFSFRSFDGLRIHGFHFLPPSDKNAGYPVLIKIHGGPEAQARPAFDGFDQYLINELGFSIIYPNIRGSTGYGVPFEMLDNSTKRRDAIFDILSLHDWITEQKDLDPSHVVLYGSSYGGYVALMALIEGQGRFKGAITVNGVTDIGELLASLPRERLELRRVEYGDERDAEIAKFFAENSPIDRSDQIDVPVLVIQSENDARVSETLATKFIESMCSAGGEVFERRFADEGHTVRQFNSRMATGADMALFLVGLRSGAEIQLSPSCYP